jgi:protoheme IX farnesyltransferase
LLAALPELLKLRIVALLLLAAVGGAFLGAGGPPSLGPLTVLLVTGAMASGGASALNQYLERHSDALMRRTRARPLVEGRVRRPAWVLALGLALVAIPVLAMLPFNPPLSFFLALGAAIYVGIYTLWLKPRSTLNIVIGGAAGSAAVLSGGAAVGAWSAPAVWVLALMLFLWTPSHFWSLALLYRADYQRADFPMLPARVSPRQAAGWVALHTGATALAGLLLGLSPGMGPAYWAVSLLAALDLAYHNARLIKEPVPRRARALFMASNRYLMLVLLAIMVEAWV